MLTPTDAGGVSSWPSIVAVVGPPLGLIVGFCLNEWSYFRRTRSEDRRAVGKALAELLEVRHFLKSLPIVVETVKKTLPGPITAHSELMIRRVLWTIIPMPEGMQERYEEAVSAVSAFLPVLAFKLRYKNMVGPFLERLYGIVPIEPNVAPLFLNMEDEIFRQTIPELEELIKKLASIHERDTAKDVRTLLTNPLELPQKYENLIKENFAAMAAAAQAQGGAQPAEAPPPPTCGTKEE